MQVRTVLLAAVVIGVSARTPALAQGAAPGVPVGTARVVPPAKAWTVTLGFAPVLAPAWQGSRTTAFSIYPDVRLNYREMVFASIPDGLGWNMINREGWMLGPLVKLRFRRDEAKGGSPFLIAGESAALIGLGDVPAAGEAGGFAQYSPPGTRIRLRAEVRQGFGGHDGVIADTVVSYNGRTGNWLYSFAGRATFAGAGYTRAYFGVDAAQSAASGLAEYTAGAGVVSYGVNAGIVRPLSASSAVTLFAGYDRLGDAAAASSLVRERGQRGQFSAGLGFGFRFGWD